MRDIHENLPNLLYRLAQILEALVGVVLVIAITASMLFLAMQSGLLWSDLNNTDAFRDFLGYAFSVVIGIEFLKMLCRHSMSAVVEVVLFATARQMVVEHTDAFETLVMVLALAVLFLIRKYLFIPGLDDKDHSFHLPFLHESRNRDEEV